MEAVNRRTAIVTLIGAASAAAGCAVNPPPGMGAAGAQATPAQAEPTPSTTVDSRPRAPLTGLPVADAALLNHAAVAVKVSDVQSAHPQLGLNAADIVFVEPNGVSYIRLCAVFHSKFPELVGPVRSIRPVDVPLLSPLKPVFANTGAALWVMAYIGTFSRYIENLYSFKAGVHGTSAYYTMPHRFRVHSVFCRPDELRKRAKRLTAPPAEPYLPFADSEEQASTETSTLTAKTVSVPWGPGDTWSTSYHYDADTGQYLRNEPWGKHVLEDGQRVVTDNVLVVPARWRMAKIYPGGGDPDPVVSIIDGRGKFYYAHQGKYVRGTWTKGAVDELFKFTLDDGSPLQMAPGRTFFELPQIDAKVKFGS
ncbi:DUF3048 domain-containing protein [Propionicimonas sp.]|uniref:DUF3048 domain-containing protein n=1 Tax=Propionicimonas sp. TaxID=1955623 RepID=UPI0017B0E77F|nr:DUF3048 domain-containing protein [Propionicimonas sp.]MBU3977915.1 DUF3048 domain-containing protein [Actinomycetota bacterium]MBA3021862.1 DUF3048 domain-containing protein [Propionicimonas sp.]MBU3985359.1 DUF3048 domain-containing protein [Actinomycetota bacterium]MBU4007414.1 DUF3048 domain-containing protein [Actinomycetota bacterium]MBU4065640.1 DUF3048 domain-containing protein [Actinomycetota bacterium]